MSRSPSRRRLATSILVAAALVAVACGQASQPANQRTPTDSQPPPSAARNTGPFIPMAYPPDGPAPCDQAGAPDPDHAPYSGSIRRIRALDALTVTFELCAPDVAFRSRLALPAFAINDTEWLDSHVDPGQNGDQAIIREVNGTGPYRLDAWSRGSEIRLVRHDAYRGTAARTERLIVPLALADAAGRLAELQAGSVDGIDDIAAANAGTVAADVDLQAVAQAGMNIFYVGFNNTYAPFDKPMVRQAIAMGINRARLVETLYPPGSEVASHFSPCAIPNGCNGDGWYEFDRATAQQLLTDAGYPDGFATTIQYRDVVRPYLPDPTGVAMALQAQLLDNLNIRAELEVIAEDAFLTMVDEGRADGIHLLGRTQSIPDLSALLDPHFGARASREFGEPNAAIVAALAAAAATTDPAVRAMAYTDANLVIWTQVPMIPIAHAGSMTAYRADVAGAALSPMGHKRFASMTPGDRGQLVWLAGAEPPGLYCADETDPVARLVCAQLTEGLYAFDSGGASVSPALAESCEPNPELTIWTCTLRAGVAFHDGEALDANDVVLSFAVQWDAEHPQHRGREGSFRPFIDTFGGLLNPPA